MIRLNDQLIEQNAENHFEDNQNYGTYVNPASAFWDVYLLQETNWESKLDLYMSTILLKSNLQNESEVGDAMLLKKIASESSQGQMKAE